MNWATRTMIKSSKWWGIKNFSYDLIFFPYDLIFFILNYFQIYKNIMRME